MFGVKNRNELTIHFIEIEHPNEKTIKIKVKRER